VAGVIASPVPGDHPAVKLGLGRCRVTRPKRRSRSELLTTLTNENPIAAPATMGLSKPIVASGIAAVL
jgi:hypothetical protein